MTTEARDGDTAVEFFSKLYDALATEEEDDLRDLRATLERCGIDVDKTIESAKQLIERHSAVLPPEGEPEPLQYVMVGLGGVDIYDNRDEAMEAAERECEQVARVMGSPYLARGVAEGVLPAEPAFSNPHREPTWLACIEQTLEHIKLGGHPEDLA